MKEFTLDTDLEVLEIPDRASDDIVFLENVTRNNFKDWSIEEQKYVYHDLTGKYRSHLHGDVYHTNYLRYLEICYNTHRGYVISPDILWNIIVNELATEVKNNVEKYRFLFTDSPEKKDIIVQGIDPFELDMDQIIDKLRDLVPSDVDNFIPVFSTTTKAASHSHYCAFADMVSPYYNYMMLLCGFPKARVEGTREDWMQFLGHMAEVAKLFDDSNIYRYFDNIADTVSHLADIDSHANPEEFLNSIFTLERCGSGSQVMLSGWITKFYMEVPSTAYIENFSASYAKVDYKIVGSEEEFSLFSGLFCSDEIDGFLVPRFSRVSCVRELLGEKLSQSKEAAW